MRLHYDFVAYNAIVQEMSLSTISKITCCFVQFSFCMNCCPCAEHSSLHAEAQHAIPCLTCLLKGLQISQYHAQQSLCVRGTITDFAAAAKLQLRRHTKSW